MVSVLIMVVDVDEESPAEIEVIRFVVAIANMFEAYHFHEFLP